ncbi:hypothetical protein COL75_13410 [Bacillus wiedmannii]|uniref:hypothetical protein n=1 Tax=Bacillus wiedmannii TaxID=1890302 RepID=UPI000BF78865|nr:hypothetical protein [Bacillus wiedmannii]PFZ03185.1 hypothetical protein COL75_13410 [Bacillus wiedmannii]
MKNHTFENIKGLTKIEKSLENISGGGNSLNPFKGMNPTAVIVAGVVAVGSGALGYINGRKG